MSEPCIIEIKNSLDPVTQTECNALKEDKGGGHQSTTTFFDKNGCPWEVKDPNPNRPDYS